VKLSGAGFHSLPPYKKEDRVAGEGGREGKGCDDGKENKKGRGITKMEEGKGRGRRSGEGGGGGWRAGGAEGRPETRLVLKQGGVAVRRVSRSRGVPVEGNAEAVFSQRGQW
jgi:hypothetical protein